MGAEDVAHRAGGRLQAHPQRQRPAAHDLGAQAGLGRAGVAGRAGWLLRHVLIAVGCCGGDGGRILGLRKEGSH